jgi:hypothetical protein
VCVCALNDGLCVTVAVAVIGKIVEGVLIALTSVCSYVVGRSDTRGGILVLTNGDDPDGK